MGAGIGSALEELPPDSPGASAQSHGLEAGDWHRAAERVGAYLASMGVREPREAESLREQVKQRVEARATKVPLEDPVEAAIEETLTLLDRWLAAELEVDGDANTVAAARAAVLGGAVPGWTARWAGLSGRSLAAEIRALCIPAVPESAPLTMEPNPIDLFLHRLARRISDGLRRLLGVASPPGTPTGRGR
jgi:hypothetical protein